MLNKELVMKHPPNNYSLFLTTPSISLSLLLIIVL